MYSVQHSNMFGSKFVPAGCCVLLLEYCADTEILETATRCELDTTECEVESQQCVGVFVAARCFGRWRCFRALRINRVSRDVLGQQPNQHRGTLTCCTYECIA